MAANAKIIDNFYCFFDEKFKFYAILPLYKITKRKGKFYEKRKNFFDNGYC